MIQIARILQACLTQIKVGGIKKELETACKDHGYFVGYQRNFDGTRDFNTMVVEFPCRFPDHAVLAMDVRAIDQLEVVKRLQTEWSDNAVSVTLFYRKEELEDIKAWLKQNYSTSVKSVALLLHYDHGFDQPC